MTHCPHCKGPLKQTKVHYAGELSKHGQAPKVKLVCPNRKCMAHGLYAGGVRHNGVQEKTRREMRRRGL